MNGALSSLWLGRFEAGVGLGDFCILFLSLAEFEVLVQGSDFDGVRLVGCLRWLYRCEKLRFPTSGYGRRKPRNLLEPIPFVSKAITKTIS